MMKRALSVLLATVILTGCGYHLYYGTGYVSMPKFMQRTAIVSETAYSGLVRSLARELSLVNVKVVDNPREATAVIHILSDVSHKRVISVDKRGRPQSYEVYYSVRFSVTSKGRTLLSPQTVSLTNDYVFDSSKVLAGGAEVRRLLRSMRKDVVQAMMRRIAALGSKKKTTEKPDEKQAPASKEQKNKTTDGISPATPLS